MEAIVIHLGVRKRESREKAKIRDLYVLPCQNNSSKYNHLNIMTVFILAHSSSSGSESIRLPTLTFPAKGSICSVS